MRPKKVLILSCRGGYGHEAATNTITHLLADGWETRVIYPINDLQIWGIPCGEAFFNYLISRGYIRLMDLIARYLAPHLFIHRTEKTAALIEKQIIEEGADLLISVIPFVNYPASVAAKRQNIPFLLITTDNDLHNWVLQLENLQHSHFKVTVGSKLSASYDLLLKHNISPSVIEVTGLPLRPSFINPPNSASFRARYNIPADRPVVLLMMGGAGAQIAYEYAKAILKLNLPIHLIVCAGRNIRLAEKLKNLSPQPHIVTFTEQIHEWMAIADLLITKPGPGTINEALALKIPVLLDETSSPIFWEKVNVEFVKSLGIGESVSDLSHLKTLLPLYLFDQAHRANLAKAYEDVPVNDFHLRIHALINELMSESEPLPIIGSVLHHEASIYV